MLHWALLHSPLTGPAVWDSLAREARRHGIETQVLTMPDLSVIDPPFYWRIAADLARQIEGSTNLIVHSGAGGLAACLAATCAGNISQVVFVDAILPHPNRNWFATANASFAERIRSMVTDGMVPSWDRWFPEGALANLIPDHADRKRFTRELKPVPVAFLDEVAPGTELDTMSGWSYLRISKVYEDEAKAARHLGYPTLRLDLHHLAMMTHPAEVVAALRNLVRG